MCIVAVLSIHPRLCKVGERVTSKLGDGAEPLGCTLLRRVSLAMDCTLVGVESWESPQELTGRFPLGTVSINLVCSVLAN